MTWFRLKWLEAKIAFGGEFGQSTKYRRLCLERKAMTASEKLPIAQEILAGGATSINVYLKQHEKD